MHFGVKAFRAQNAGLVEFQRLSPLDFEFLCNRLAAIQFQHLVIVLDIS